MTHYIVSEVRTPMYDDEPVQIEDFIVGIFPTMKDAENKIERIVKHDYKNLTPKEEEIVRGNYRIATIETQ